MIAFMYLYITKFWAPIMVLVAGLILVSFFLYLHLSLKTRIVRWIAKSVFRNENATSSAEGIFNVATSLIVTIGGLWIILAIYYLSNG